MITGSDSQKIGAWAWALQLTVLLGVYAIPAQSRDSGPPNVDDSWHLTFQSEFEIPGTSRKHSSYSIEEFDRVAPTSDNAKWEFRYGPNKQAYAVESNAFVAMLKNEGLSALILRTSQSQSQNENYSNPMRTGYIRTRNYENTGPDNKVRFKQRFGYFEARMKLNSSPGQWGAFWMMPTSSIWCADGSGRDGTEIDVVEGFPVNAQSASKRNQSVNMAIHYDGYAEYHKKQNLSFPTAKHKKQFSDFDSTEFHVYGFLWTPDKYVWYVDGVPVHEINDPDLISQVPNYLKLSTEVADWSGKINPAQLPADTVVDWVRVWQTKRMAQGNPFIFEVEASNTDISETTRILRMKTGKWCVNNVAQSLEDNPGRVSTPVPTPVDARQIGIRVWNDSDDTNNLRLILDGVEVRSWKDINPDNLFILKHDIQTRIAKQIEVVWSGDLMVDQIYVVPQRPFYE